MAEQKLPDKAQETEMKREKVRVVPIKYMDILVFPHSLSWYL